MRFLVFFVFSIFASASTLADFETLEASFVQVVTNDQNQKITYSGKLYLKKPDLALWEYKTPLEKSIYIIADQVTIIEPNLYQATIIKNPTTLNIMEMYRSSKPTKNKNESTTTLNKTKLTLTHKNSLIVSVRYKDELDNSVVVTLFDQKTDQKLIDAFFAPKIPEDFDIIKP